VIFDFFIGLDGYQGNERIRRHLRREFLRCRERSLGCRGRVVARSRSRTVMLDSEREAFGTDYPGAGGCLCGETAVGRTPT
jgi:hypothetical protein